MKALAVAVVLAAAAIITATHHRTEQPVQGPLPPRTYVAGMHR